MKLGSQKKKKRWITNSYHLLNLNQDQISINGANKISHVLLSEVFVLLNHAAVQSQENTQWPTLILNWLAN